MRVVKQKERRRKRKKLQTVINRKEKKKNILAHTPGIHHTKHHHLQFTDFIPAVRSRMLTQCLGLNQRPVSMAMTWTTFKDSFPLKTSHISFSLQVPSVLTLVSKIKCNQAHILFVLLLFFCFGSLSFPKITCLNRQKNCSVFQCIPWKKMMGKNVEEKK